VPAPASVQSVEASFDEPLTRVVRPFSTGFSTQVLKSSDRRLRTCRLQAGTQILRVQRKPPDHPGGLYFRSRQLARDLFQKFLVDVEVGVDILHVVLVFERFHQPDHGVGRLSLQLDVILWNERNT
jgi:hypothetical protein